MDWPFKCYSVWTPPSATVTGTHVKQLICIWRIPLGDMQPAEAVSPYDGGEGTRRDKAGAQTCMLPGDVRCTLSLFSLSSLWVLRRTGGGRGRVVVVETGWLTQHPLWTGNRWDPTPSTQITAKDALACSRDRFEMTTSVYWNKRRARGWGSEGNNGRSLCSSGETGYIQSWQKPRNISLTKGVSGAIWKVISS